MLTKSIQHILKRIIRTGDPRKSAAGEMFILFIRSSSIFLKPFVQTCCFFSKFFFLFGEDLFFSRKFSELSKVVPILFQKNTADLISPHQLMQNTKRKKRGKLLENKRKFFGVPLFLKKFLVLFQFFFFLFLFKKRNIVLGKGNGSIKEE